MSGHMTGHFQRELSLLTAEEPPGIKQAAIAVGEYLDCCVEPPPEPMVVWATFPNCFEEVTCPVAAGWDEGGALLLVKHNVAMRVMPRAEFFRRQAQSQWLVEQLSMVAAVGANIMVVVEARRDNGGHKNRVCVYGFTNKELPQA